MSWPIHPLGTLAAVAGHLPTVLAAGWLVRAPFVSRDEGHEAITRAALEDLPVTTEQQGALIRGVRAPDVSLAGFLISALPFAQRRHALRAWSGTTTPAAVREVREFLVVTHLRGLSLPDGRRRWAKFGEVLHCLQDSYSPAHVNRSGGRIVRMKHWGPLDALRGSRFGDEHGFPADPRDSAWSNGALTDEARAAVEVSRRYLQLATRHSGSREGSNSWRRDLDAFLDHDVRAV